MIKVSRRILRPAVRNVLVNKVLKEATEDLRGLSK